MKYDVDYFIQKFEAIPEDEWGMGWLANELTGKKCMLGHCGQRDYINPTPEVEALSRIFDLEWTTELYEINDGIGKWKHLAIKPKDRVLKALKVLKNDQN